MIGDFFQIFNSFNDSGLNKILVIMKLNINQPAKARLLPLALPKIPKTTSPSQKGKAAPESGAAYYNLFCLLI
ncbi:hypothetical protein CK934_11490 [Chitinophaga sp. MD30]|nr:hypothetical protein CK934_11490 [Chitinophaga sp. MD30]